MDLISYGVQAMPGAVIENQALGLVSEPVDVLGVRGRKHLVIGAMDQENRGLRRETRDDTGAKALGRQGHDAADGMRGGGLNDHGPAEGVADQHEGIDALAVEIGDARENVKRQLP